MNGACEEPGASSACWLAMRRKYFVGLHLVAAHAIAHRRTSARASRRAPVWPWFRGVLQRLQRLVLFAGLQETSALAERLDRGPFAGNARLHGNRRPQHDRAGIVGGPCRRAQRQRSRRPPQCPRPTGTAQTMRMAVAHSFPAGHKRPQPNPSSGSQPTCRPMGTTLGYFPMAPFSGQPRRAFGSRTFTVSWEGLRHSGQVTTCVRIGERDVTPVIADR